MRKPTEPVGSWLVERWCRSGRQVRGRHSRGERRGGSPHSLGPDMIVVLGPILCRTSRAFCVILQKRLHRSSFSARWIIAESSGDATDRAGGNDASGRRHISDGIICTRPNGSLWVASFTSGVARYIPETHVNCVGGPGAQTLSTPRTRASRPGCAGFFRRSRRRRFRRGDLRWPGGWSAPARGGRRPPPTRRRG